MKPVVSNNVSCRFADWEHEKILMMSVRRPVFVVEQRVPEEIEVDDLDPLCLHVVALNHNGQPVGTARMTENGHIGRCAVLAQWRGQGIGTRLVTMLINHAAEAGLESVCLHSQVSAMPFYEKLGFVPHGDEFVEAGIIHKSMVNMLS
jgi:predicted GNAT family N-acyltransferase